MKLFLKRLWSTTIRFSIRGLKQDIQYYWGDDRLEINLGNRVTPRIRMVLCVEFFITTAIAVLFFIRAFHIPSWELSLLLNSGAILLFVLASYRLLSRISYHEKIIATQQHLILQNKTLVSRHTWVYDWRYMGLLHYLGKEGKKQHTAKHYDYLNFSHQELLLQDLHQSGNLFFTYKDTEHVRFARGVYSWDAEEIVRMIQLFAGGNIQLGSEWERLLESSEWEE